MVSVLFIAVIILCICLTRFYFDVTKNTGNTDSSADISNIVRTYGDKRVFESENGCFGVLNNEDAVVIEPQWMEIIDVTQDLALVSERINDTILIGGIDFEENVVLPFVFRSMIAIDDRYYIGIVDEDDSRVIYNERFQPVFYQSYDNALYENGTLDLETEKCTFSYNLADEQPLLRKAEMFCQIGKLPLEWRIANQVLLADLTEEDLLRINQCVESYMDMLIQSDFTGLPDISGGDYIGGLERPNSFAPGIRFDEISDFSFGFLDQDEGIYGFSFSVTYHSDQPMTTETEATAPSAEGNQMVHLQFGFSRNSNNKMILTSADLSF